MPQEAATSKGKFRSSKWGDELVFA